ncbi:hypothetical protein [Heliophilum fasciatum]|uniref:MgtE-like protein n=1 Tax=Heliophilum fasciatum TaxID=35700 RepID=A0A4R2RKR6_9FIRM|nr:hypothetical protein [Heliophilum fasciatum]MCW2277940.1 flagellar motility protein MotE (MotC chaperone) [Heliophilum fasciatum]TCP64490.1 hypothetical protein EDD73_10931 [Heliophilum fasciatum]
MAESANRKKTATSSLMWLLILAIPVVGMAAVAAAQVAGIIDARPWLQQIPVVGAWIPQKTPDQIGFQQTLEERNMAKLQAENADLALKLAEAEAAKAASASAPPQPSAEEVEKKKQVEAEKQKQAALLQEQIKLAEEAKARDQKLLEKLLAMKPAAAAKIMQEFPDDDISRLLGLMEVEDAAKMMAAFEPARAARIIYPSGGTEYDNRLKDQLQTAQMKEKYQQLGATLAAMNSADAVLMMEQMQDNMAASVLRAMNQDAAGKLLSAIAAANPSRAAMLVNLMTSV